MKLLEADSFYNYKDSLIEITSTNDMRVKVPSTGGSIKFDGTSYDQQMWVNQHYLVADVEHACHDVLVIIFKLVQEDGKHIHIHFGVLPHVKTRLCLPLQALDGGKLFLDRYPGVLQTVLRGDSSINRDQIHEFVIETIPSITERTFTLSNIHLREDEPEFDYPNQAYIDELGQLKEKEWSGKVESVQDVIEKLQQEWYFYENTTQSDESIGQFGGWKGLTFAATGYFRTEFDGKNWWFVDPEGYATFSLGLDCMGPHSAMKIGGMEHLISWLPGKKDGFEDAWDGDSFDYGIANLIRAFGSDWYTKWAELNTARLKDWKINTIGNWSQEAFIKSSSIPYVYPMEDFPTTEAKIYRDFPDVYSPEYEMNATLFAKQLEPFLDDQFMIGYFMRNEPHWAFVEGLNLTEFMLTQPYLYDSKKKFIDELKETYGTIDNLNQAWETDFTDFQDLQLPHKIVLTHASKQQEDFAIFNRKLIRRYVEIPTTRCKQVDPHHLNLGMRYAWVANDDLLSGCELFDVFSINSYSTSPDAQQIDYISQKLNKPVMIGEFHFGAADVGMLAYGIRASHTQHERGLAYRYYVEHAATIPGLIGVHYFQFNDQPVLGRFDGENYQIGIVDVCQQPYEAFVEQMKVAHERVYSIRMGEVEAMKEAPIEIPKTGF